MPIPLPIPKLGPGVDSNIVGIEVDLEIGNRSCPLLPNVVVRLDPIARGWFLKFLREELTINSLNGNDLCWLPFPIPDHHEAVKGVELKELLTHKDKNIPSHNKMLHGLMEDHSIL